MNEDAGQLGAEAEAWPLADDAGHGAPADDSERLEESAPSRRFCGVCGAPWQQLWTQCLACSPPAAALPFPASYASGPANVYAAWPTGGTASEPDAERPRLTSAIVLYFALLAVSLIGFIAGVAGASELSIDFSITAVMTVVILGWCAIGARTALLMLFRPAPAKWFLAAAVAAVFTFSLAYVVIEGLIQGLGLESIDYITPYLSGGYGLATIILMICVQPAVFEELAFRGIVFDALRPTLSSTEAVFVSAGMFMVLHLSPGAFPHTFALGVIAGFLRVRTGSLLPGVLMHFVHNLLCVVTEYSPTG